MTVTQTQMMKISKLVLVITMPEMILILSQVNIDLTIKISMVYLTW